MMLMLPGALCAAVFSGNARIEAADPSGGLSWTNSANALTVSCWFKLAVPSDKTLSENMTILVNRRTGNESSMFGYLIRYNYNNGNVEFLSCGTGGLFTDTLISAPYLERWYHAAVVRSGDVFTGYVDGRKIFERTVSIGNSANSDGVSVGGWGTMGSGTYLYGEVQEVAVYQTALDPASIIDNMFRDQPSDLPLKGYYKLGFAENASEGLRNYAPVPPTNTTPAVVAGAGQVTFEEANQAGEQSAFDSRKNGGTDALAPLSGSFAWSDVLLARPVPGIAFDLRMAYSSANAFNSSGLGGGDTPTIGKGWRHSFEVRMIPSSYFSAVPNVNTVGLMSWDGAIETWERDGSTKRYKTRHKEYRGELFEKDDQTYEWVTPERLIYRFRNPMSGSLVMGGRLIEIVDSNSNTVKLAYQESSGLVTQVVDTVGGVYRFSYGAQNLCTNIAFQGWSVNFTYDAQNRLVTNSLSAPAGYAAVSTIRTFAYDGSSGLLKTVTDPRGNAAVTVAYDKYGRMTNQVDALNRATMTAYGVPAKRQITRTDPEGYKWLETYDRKGRVTENRDPLGNATVKTFDVAGNVRTLTDPRGSVTLFDYDDRANILTNVNALAQKRVWTYHPYYNKPVMETDPLGWTTHYDYDAAGNMTNQWDGIGSLVQYAYDGKGLVTSAKDANGNVTRFGYEASGFRCRTVDPAGYTKSVALNELGWILAATNALGQVTTFAYDVNGNVVQTTDPLFRVVTSVYDANGNKVSQSDAKGQLTYTYYDAANQRTQMTDRAGAVWKTAYTLRGEVWKVTDPQSNTVVSVYDAANRLATVTDPLGGSVSNVYDAAGNLTDTYDKLGQRWRKTYDRLNRVFAEQDPLGNTRRVTFDVAGRLDTVTSPNGFVSTHQYDGRGRLRRWVDAEGYVWLYDYDGVGSITNITDALGGHYVMTYGPRNERTLERNQDGFEWRYAYDALLRPLQQNDPNGLVRSVVYDDGGRIDYVGFSTGRTDDYQYDDNDNLTLLSRSRPGQAPTPTSLVYDPMDRPTQVTDAFGKTVRYAYDNLSRVDTLTYPGNRALKYRYDALSRLTNQTDWASRRLDYAFDKANRLVRRGYPNGVVQNNSFDSAGRISGLAYGVPPMFGSPQPVAAYLFENNVLDDGGGKNDMIAYNTTFSAGKSGQALSFNGTNAYAVIANNLLNKIPLTVCAWVSVDQRSDGTSFPSNLICNDNPAMNGHGFGVNAWDGGAQISVDYHNGFRYLSVPNLVTGAWNHVSVVYSAGNVKTYLNGVVIDSYNYTSAALDGVETVWIGKHNASVDAFFKGRVDDLRIYDSALSSNDVGRIIQESQPHYQDLVSYAYAYDRNGNKTSSIEKGTLDWPEPTRIDEAARYTASGRLVDRTDAASTNAPFVYHYDASGNMTNAVGAGQGFALTYDEDNRVLTVNWDCGLTSKRIENRYDALGRRISRKVDGVETRYVLDIQGGMERILCDTTAAGQITATYVHGNDLAYRVATDNTYVCYHADAQANIIAITDSGGTNVAQYAYTPYGRSFGVSEVGGHQSAASGNPYRFAGSQGVMEELPDLYFMRARYYSAEAGMFLSTDPVKKIGAGWKPVAYGYAEGNPLTGIDPRGTNTKFLNDAIEWVGVKVASTVVKQTIVKPAIKAVAEQIAVGSGKIASTIGGFLFSFIMAIPLQCGGDECNDYTGYPEPETKEFDLNPFKNSNYLSNSDTDYHVKTTAPNVYSGNNVVSALTGSTLSTGAKSQQSTMSQLAPIAASYAQKISDVFSTVVAKVTSQSGTTTVSSGNSGGRSGSSIKTAAANVVSSVKSAVTTASNNVSATVKTAVTTVKQAVSSVVSSVKSFVSSLFGGGKKK